MSAVAGVFAKETGYGFAFTIARDPVSLARIRHGAAGCRERRGPGARRAAARTREGRRQGEARPSHLQIIK